MISVCYTYFNLFTLLSFIFWLVLFHLAPLHALLSSATIKGHNKVALKLGGVKAIMGGQLQDHAIIEGKL